MIREKNGHAAAGGSLSGMPGPENGREAAMAASLERRYGRAGAKEAKRAAGPRRRNSTPSGEKPKNIGRTIERLSRYVMREKLRLLGALLCVVVSTAANLGASYMLRPIINTYIVPLDGSRGDAHGLFFALILMLLIYLAGIGATWLQSYLLMQIAQNSLQNIRNDLFDHMQTLPIRYYDQTPRGDLMSRFTNDVDNIGNMLSSTLVSLFSSGLMLAGTFALMLYTNVWLTLVTIVMLPLLTLVIGKIAGSSSRYYSGQQSSLGALNGYIEEMITGARVVKVFGHEETVREEFGILNRSLKGNQLRAQFFGGIMGPVMNAFNQINYTLTAVIGGMLCLFKSFDIGGLTVFLNYSRQFGRPINELSMTMNSLFAALAGAERVFAVMDEAPEAADDADAYVPDPMRGEVELSHVYFGYTPEHVILKDISLHVLPGQKVAFVGSTGAGKTTITNLLNRFYDIHEGSITIDGVDIRHYKREELRKNIAMVLQDTHLFTGTIMNNIRYGRPDATDEEVIEAAKSAYADHFIRKLPEGYQTMIEGDGGNLSQGQRQLLNIARAAVSKAPVLVLDEATSSVDTMTEKYISLGMDRLMKARTTFMIAHRLSTVRDAALIMVLEHGEIIERGTHEELLAKKGRYYELYTGRAELD